MWDRFCEAVGGLRVGVDFDGQHFASFDILVDFAVLDVDVPCFGPTWVVFAPSQCRRGIFKNASGVLLCVAYECADASEPDDVARAMVCGHVLTFGRGQGKVALAV